MTVPIATRILIANVRHIGPGLDIRPVGPVARGASRFENLLAPQKTDWPPKKTYWPPKKLTGTFLKPNLCDEKIFA